MYILAVDWWYNDWWTISEYKTIEELQKAIVDWETYNREYKVLKELKQKVIRTE